jgi:hypothetical protein
MAKKDLQKQYERFHGHGPRTARVQRFDPPTGFVVLGEAVAVEYRCDKLNGGGDGTRAIYRHKFDKGAVVVADQAMRRQLYILGPRIIVTDAGIEH